MYAPSARPSSSRTSASSAALGGGSASARRRYAAALCGAPRAPARLAASRSAATVARLAGGLRAEQVQPDALRVGTFAREQRGGVRMP